MNIEYKDIKEFSCCELERLFLSVEWSSGHFMDIKIRLITAK